MRTTGLFEVRCGTCGATFQVNHHRIRKHKRHFCTEECRSNAPKRALDETRTYRCSYCKNELPGTAFIWNTLASGPNQGKRRRRGYCRTCEVEARKAYHATHREQEKMSHRAWRQRCLSSGDEGALRWYFRRHLSAYRKRTAKNGFPSCDLTEDWLCGQFHRQEGKCFYTGVALRWNSFGVGKVERPPDLLSVDRRDNKKGYTMDNVVLCTYAINATKRDLSDVEFYAMCENVLSLRGTRLKG